MSVTFPPVLLPNCARCRRPVERLERSENFATAEVIFDVFCHGQRQTVRLRYEDLFGVTSIEPGEAFALPKLLPAITPEPERPDPDRTP